MTHFTMALNNLQGVVMLLIGFFYAVPIGLSVLWRIIKTKGKVLHTKARKDGMNNSLPFISFSLRK